MDKVLNLEEQLLNYDESKWKTEVFNMIKNLSFDDNVFKWYLLTRKESNDFTLYSSIQRGKNLKACYKRIIHNVKKNGNKDMQYEQLINLYLSKRFNQRVLLPMIKQKAKEKRVNIYR